MLTWYAVPARSCVMAQVKFRAATATGWHSLTLRWLPSVAAAAAVKLAHKGSELKLSSAQFTPTLTRVKVTKQLGRF